MSEPITFRSEAFRNIQAGEVVDVAPQQATDTGTTHVQLVGVATKTDIDEIMNDLHDIKAQIRQIESRLTSQDITQISTRFDNLLNYLSKWINTGNLNMNDIHEKVNL